MSPEGSQARKDALDRLFAEFKATVRDIDRVEVTEVRAALAAVRALCADATDEGVGMVPVCAVLALMRLEAPVRPPGSLNHPAGTRMPPDPKESDMDAAQHLMASLLIGPTP